MTGCFLEELPEMLIGDKPFHTDVLVDQLAEQSGIEMTLPNLI